MPVTLSVDHDELAALRRLLARCVPVAPAIGLDPEVLERLRDRLPALVWCSHCDALPPFAKGLCEPDYRYRRKYGVLPPESVLVARQRRKDAA